MPANNVEPVLTGFIVADPLISDTTIRPSSAAPTGADSNYTENGPVPGVPVYQRGSIGVSSATAGDRGPQLEILPLGAQSSPTAYRVQRAGMPGVGGAEVAARLQIGGTNYWMGWETPQVFGQLSTAFLNRSGDSPRNFAGVDLQDGRVCVVWNETGVILARTYSGDDHDWQAAAVTVADSTLAMDADGAQQQSSAFADDPIDIIRTDSGRLLVAVLGVAPSATSPTGGTDLVLHYSDDDGATWISSSLAGYDVALSLVTGRSYDCITMGYYGGSVLLLVGYTQTVQEVTTRGWLQYASSSDGADFQYIETFTTNNPGRPHIVVSLDGVYIVSYVAQDTNYYPYCRRVVSPYLPLSAADEQTIGALSGVTNINDTTGWTGPDGTVFVAFNIVARVFIAYSTDSGASWVDYETGLLRIPNISAIERLQATTMNSRVVWIAGQSTHSIRGDGPLMLLESGGWSMVPMPRITAKHPTELRSFGGSGTITDPATWVAYELPSAYGWTLTGTAGTLPPSGAFLMNISGTGEYARAFGSHTVETGMIVHFSASTTTAPVGYAVQGVGVEVDVGNGTADIRVDVRLTNAGVGLYDVNGAALIGSSVVDCTERRIWRLGVQYNGALNNVALYSRLADGDIWTLHVAGVATRRTSGGGTCAVRYGNLAAGGYDSDWYSMCVTIGDGAGNHNQTTDALSAGLVISKAPYSLPGAPLPVAPGRLHIEEGLYIRGRSGPGLRGDLWEHPIGYRFPISNVLSRSPQQPYRNAAHNTSARVLYEPDPGNVHHPGGHAVAMYVTGCNTRYLNLIQSDGITPASIAQLDLATGTTGLSFARSGNTVRVAAGGSVAAYITALDLIGGTVDFGASKLRTIRSATSGVWRHGSYTITLQLADVDGTEPTSGTIDIWRTSGAVAVLGYTTPHRYWGFAHTSQPTATGYYQVGRVVIGQLAILGNRWGNGMTTTTAPNVQVQEMPGAISTRRLAPTQRVIGVSWPEGVALNYGDDPSFLTGGGTQVGMIGDISAADTITSQVGSYVSPVVLCPAIERDPAAVSAETIQLIGRQAAIYGSLTNQITFENVYGTETECEMLRVTGVELVEEV